jgi:hypothetical protein
MRDGWWFRTKLLRGVATAALAASTIVGLALPAHADDNSIRDHGCTITAYDPTANYAANTATAEGRFVRVV